MRRFSMILVLLSFALILIGAYVDSQQPIDIGKTTLVTGVLCWLISVFNDMVSDIRLGLYR